MTGTDIVVLLNFCVAYLFIFAYPFSLGCFVNFIVNIYSLWYL